MKIASLIALAFILNLTITAGETGDGWVLEKNKDDIRIWTRKTGESKIKSIKAIAIYDASIAQLTSVLTDIEAYPKWMSDVETTKILKKVSENEMYYYLLLDVPWPLSNRDNVVHLKLENDPETKSIKATVEGHADYIPENPGVVRVPNSMGVWMLNPVGEEKTELIFEYTADPGGNIPAWAVNMFIIDGPFKTLSNLREFIKTDKH